MKKYTNYKNTQGFTLIELLVATSIFIIIVVMGITVVVSINRSQKVKQYTREQLDTMSFIMEDMVRNIRVGTNIHCFTLGNPDIEQPLSCPSSDPNSGYQESYTLALEGLYGIAGDPSDQIVYQFGTLNGEGAITKSTNGEVASFGDLPSQRLTPKSIRIDLARSGFTVIGAEPSTVGDFMQPVVIIRIVGVVTYQEVQTPFNLQTSVTLRTPDL